MKYIIGTQRNEKCILLCIPILNWLYMKVNYSIWLWSLEIILCYGCLQTDLTYYSYALTTFRFPVPFK